MPQLSGSVWKDAGSTQPVPHCIWPVGQVATQAEFEQNGVAAGQALPHVPQFMPSAAVLAHAVPQALRGAAQVQAAFTHVCIGPHAVAHMMLPLPPVLPPLEIPPDPPEPFPPFGDGLPLLSVEEQLVLKAPPNIAPVRASAMRTQRAL